MKRFLPIFFLIVFLSGCIGLPQKDKKQTSDFISGVWITYSEIDAILKDGNFTSEFGRVISNCKSQKVTDIFVSVVPFCNSLYKSKFYPQNEFAGQYDFDILEYICKSAHKNGIRIHAWLNPYRVSNTPKDITDLPADSPINSMTENDDYILYNGIYLNPSSPKVIRLVTESVREICLGYDIDGIHFDDYFYPTASQEFDRISYEKYTTENENPLPLNEYRISSVNSLISSVYTAVKFTSKDILFSVSPAASIEKNLIEYYADVKTWCENGCVDLIIPQLYFGFKYPDENYRFDNLLKNWKDLTLNTNVRLIIGLADYKINTDMLPDKSEWQNGEQIIKRQIEICRKDQSVNGIVRFSYSYVFK